MGCGHFIGLAISLCPDGIPYQDAPQPPLSLRIAGLGIDGPEQGAGGGGVRCLQLPNLTGQEGGMIGPFGGHLLARAIRTRCPGHAHQVQIIGD